MSYQRPHDQTQTMCFSLSIVLRNPSVEGEAEKAILQDRYHSFPSFGFRKRDDSPSQSRIFPSPQL